MKLFLPTVVFLAACGGHNMLAPTEVTAPLAAVSSAEGWSETFSGALSARWVVSNHKTALGTNTFLASNVSLSEGMLGLRMTQSNGQSSGGEIQSVDRYGFGTYTWRFRASSTAETPTAAGTSLSGATSGAFIYAPGSETELDFENQAGKPEGLYLVTWKNGSQVYQEFHVGPSIYQAFHTYSVAWSATRVEYSMDGFVVAVETKHVPQVPAHIMANHWGGVDPAWGGKATNGTRWMWIEKISFSPAN